MIIEFSVKNYLSIHEKQTLSFEADFSAEREDDFVRKIGKYRILKMGILYGANASGKTNILKALQFLLDLVKSRRKRNEKLNFTPFLFNEQCRNSNAEMELIFLIEIKEEYKKFVYEIEFNNDEIVREKLQYYPSIQPALVFERVKNKHSDFDFTHGNTTKLSATQVELIKSEVLPNTSILSVFQEKNPEFPLAKYAFNWFENFMLPIITPKTILSNYSKKFFIENPEYKPDLIQFIENADLNITNYNLNEREEKISNSLRNFLLHIKELPDMKISDTMKTFELNFIHSVNEEEQLIPFDLESLGTKRIFGLSAPFLRTLKENKFLFIDEIESSLHFDMIKYLILVFLSNSKNSQMLFTTHNLLLLDWDILRNDVIWFTDKNPDASTELYSLSEFKGLNRKNILKHYLAGNFGAKPDIWKYKLDLEKM